MITAEMSEEQFINRIDNLKSVIKGRPIKIETLQTKAEYLSNYNSAELENLLIQIEARTIDHPSGWIYALEHLYDRKQILFVEKKIEETIDDQLGFILKSSNSFYQVLGFFVVLVLVLPIPLFLYLYWEQSNWKYTILYTIGVSFFFLYPYFSC